MNSKLVAAVVVTAVIAVGCGGPQILTEKRMVEWGPILNIYMGTNMEGGNSFPETLEEMPPDLTSDLKKTDGWGNPLLYRLLRVDKYNLISAGPDGEFGNDDDIVLENGAFYEAAKIYKENPLKL
ncbi:MAG: hypothetical protein V2I67_10165 [Thermoanaerobaculales bacterium]|jgi:hypothetical protein|nr:hypothetical protein [Thermoanaerobaculales bacterium]